MEFSRTELYTKTKGIVKNYSVQIAEMNHGDVVVFGGVIQSIRDFRHLEMTDGSEPEVFLTIEDPVGTYELAFVPASIEQYEKTYGSLQVNQIVYGVGRKYILDTTHKTEVRKNTLVFDNHEENSRVIVAELKLLD